MSIEGNAIFELIEPDRHIRIYANGVVEGVKEGQIINHIGAAIRPELKAYFSKSHDSELVRVPNTKSSPNSGSRTGLSHGSIEKTPSRSAQVCAATGEK